MLRRFRDRRDAGRRLADEVKGLALEDPVVLGLPRGGVVVAREVADALDAPLDVLVVRKLGAPTNPEYGLGAVGEDGVRVLDRTAMSRLGLDEDALEPTIAREHEELERRLAAYRGAQPGVPIAGRSVVVVDDGMATGVTAEAAVQVCRARGAGRVVLALPVAAPSSLERVRQHCDETVCLLAPPGFAAVGSWYASFGQTTDDEVQELLAR